MTVFVVSCFYWDSAGVYAVLSTREEAERVAKEADAATGKGVFSWSVEEFVLGVLPDELPTP